MMNKIDFCKHVAAIVTVPAGFTQTFRPLDYFSVHDVLAWGVKDEKPQCFVLANEADGIELVFDPNGCGHTKFKVGESWRTFDRRGIEDSFYHLPLYKGHVVPPLPEIVTEQLGRIAKSREYAKTAVTVPGLPNGYTLSPDRLGAMKAQLAKANGMARFSPAGMGQGHEVYRKRPHSWAQRAKPELEKFFGVSPLYVLAFDHD